VQLGLTVKAAKSNFFDRAKVQSAVDKGTHKILSKFGSYVRQRARTSLRYRQRSSIPGMAPSAHRTMVRTKTNKQGQQKKQAVSPLREFTFFAFDRSRKSVVIGPALLNAKGSARALQALEYGGSSTIWQDGKRIQILVRARPWMRPAFDEEQKQLPGLWKNSVR
jgi:hypothetical protein